MNTFSQWTRRTIICATLAAACLSPSLHAQSELGLVRVNIPFAFDFGTRHFAPGIYTLGMEGPSIMVIHRGSDSAMALVRDEITHRPPAKSKAVFLKYNDHYVLAEVWTVGSSTYLHVPRPKAEKRSYMGANPAIGSRIEVATLDQPVSPQK